MLRSRLLSMVFLALAAFTLSACSGGKPESVVEAYYEAVADGDVDAVTELMAFGSVPAAQMVQAKGKVQMIVGEMKSRIDANGGLDDIEVLESSVDETGKRANVRVQIEFDNGKTQTQTHRLVDEDGDWKILLK